MNNHKLISLVCENRCLWDMADADYQNRDICREKWKKVAAELNTTTEAVRTKWRGLRDTYRIILNKNPIKRNGNERNSMWVYLKDMEFLKDQFYKRKPHVRSETLSFENDRNSSDSEIFPDSPQNTRDEATPQQYLAAPLKRIARIDNANALQKVRVVEKQMFGERNRHEDSRNEDPDYHFMMSLLPYLRKVPEERKMIVRTKLQQVFCEEDFSCQQKDHQTRHYDNSAIDASTNDSWASGGSEVDIKTEQLDTLFSSTTPE